MDALRVDIDYRPIRVGWAISRGDFDAFRMAARSSLALWGGRFNPIIVVQNDEAADLVDLFRCDMIVSVGDSEAVDDFKKKYESHLIDPLHQPIFVNPRREQDRPFCSLLDIANAVVHLRDEKWKPERATQVYRWAPDDPLSDVLLAQYGAYLAVEETGFDYRAFVIEHLKAQEVDIPAGAPIPDKVPIGINYLARALMESRGHYSRRSTPGFYLGSHNDLEDLVAFWNIRACDVPLMFVDMQHWDRFSRVVASWQEDLRNMQANMRDEWDRQSALWSRADLRQADFPQFPEQKVRQQVSRYLWNGLSIAAPKMIIGEATTLGVVSESNRRLSFALSDRPYSANHWFHTQHLIASLNVFGPYGKQEWTYHPPYVPELNEYFGRAMHSYSDIRVEPTGVGLVVDSTSHDASITALPNADVIHRVLSWAGFTPQVSSAGLITRQLISQLEGVQGVRPFKIPGVRRLIRTHGPGSPFTKRTALQIIGSRDPDDPNSSRFDEHGDLHFGGRGTNPLTPELVFRYLVEKGLFRIGFDLRCSHCGMNSWVTLETLRDQLPCVLCGNSFDTRRQLVEANELHYRRSGVLGAERNAQGAIPVALTLQQLDTTLQSISSGTTAYLPSTELVRTENGSEIKVEIDFAWLVARSKSHRTQAAADLIVGECRTNRPITQADIDSLRAVADAIPAHRFNTYILFAKLTSFTPDEIELARSLNGPHESRVILLTARELEPYHIYERSEHSVTHKYASSAEDLARATVQLFFAPEPPAGQAPAMPTGG